VAEYFSAADIFALPTHYEAWGLVVVEAMACGLPVLTSRAAGASIAVQEGRNGALLESPADEDEIASKLKNLLEGRHESPGWIAESVLKYEWAEILPKYETVLRECVVA
jgi:UDP-glucose:(heptosyl)LPS alpha-1,3-glucosyltransferase